MTIMKRAELIWMGYEFKDKTNIMKWIVNKNIKENITLNLNNMILFNCRANKPNDLWMASDYKEFIKFEEICNDKVVLDIGANIGLFTLIASQEAKEVIAFEPFEESFEALKDNVKLNNLKNVKLINKACYDYEGRRVMNVCDSNHGANSLELKRGGDLIYIDTIMIDSLNLKPNVMKIDVEGSELNVLMGAEKTIKENKPNIFIEILPTGKLKEIKEFFKNLNYKIKYQNDVDYLFVYGGEE